jgi:TPP-dependent pyruvate/acetoin dehydrogenase alpha subunit
MATPAARQARGEHERAPGSASLTADDRRALLRFMLLMRATEDRALTLYRQGRSRAVFTAAAEACERARSGGVPR